MVKKLTPDTTISGISWQCCHCNQKFANLSKLKAHMENECNKDKPIEKPKKVNSAILAKQLLSKLPNIKAKVVVVNKTKNAMAKRKANAAKNKKMVTRSKAGNNSDKRCFWPCSKCPQIFSTEERLDIHTEKCVSSVEFIKPKKKTSNLEAFSLFEPYHFDRFRNVYICTKCLCEFNVKSAVMEHVKNEHPGFSCKLCDVTFDSIVDLGYHSSLHDESSGMTCPCCPFRSEVKAKLAFHIQTEHSSSADLINVQDVSFTCVVCNKAFYNRRKLWHHQRNYHKATIDILPSMGARLDEPCTRTPSGEPRVYLCDTCGKNFNSKYRLERHQRAMHQGLKPFVCRFCGRAFTGKDTMQKHERIHTGERPYSCEYCGKCFRQPGPFTVHLRIHTGERPYVCKFCKKGFITNQSRKSHTNNCIGKNTDYSYLNVLNY